MFIEHKELGEVTEAPAKVLKLSEAMRIGSLMSGPAFGLFVDDHGNTCAQGAALLAVGKLETHPDGGYLNHDHMQSQWPTVGYETYCRIAEMNNDKTHTRQEIADWLESQGL